MSRFPSSCVDRECSVWISWVGPGRKCHFNSLLGRFPLRRPCACVLDCSLCRYRGLTRYVGHQLRHSSEFPAIVFPCLTPEIGIRLYNLVGLSASPKALTQGNIFL